MNKLGVKRKLNRFFLTDIHFLLVDYIPRIMSQANLLSIYKCVTFREDF